MVFFLSVWILECKWFWKLFWNCCLFIVNFRKIFEMWGYNVEIPLLGMLLLYIKFRLNLLLLAFRSSFWNCWIINDLGQFFATRTKIWDFFLRSIDYSWISCFWPCYTGCVKKVAIPSVTNTEYLISGSSAILEFVFSEEFHV